MLVATLVMVLRTAAVTTILSLSPGCTAGTETSVTKGPSSEVPAPLALPGVGDAKKRWLVVITGLEAAINCGKSSILPSAAEVFKI